MERQNIFEKESFWRMDHIQLLVIADNRHNYIKLFENTKINGIKLKVEQAFWNELFLTIVPISKKNPFGLSILLNSNNRNGLPHQKEKRIVNPHFILIRNEPRGDEDNDYRNILYGLMYSNIPSCNSLLSVYLGTQRCLMFAELRKIQKELGKEDFPLITQYYHQRPSDMIFSPVSYPIVAKVGFAHAGIGKSVVSDKNGLKDLRSVISLHKDYVTTEPFIEADYELRIQKIGTKYRVMKKKLVSKYWKSNSFGSSSIEDIEFTSKFKKWIDAASTIFGGLEICAIDVLHSKKDDQFYILELNGSAIGLDPRHIQEDIQHEKELVISKIKLELLQKNISPNPTPIRAKTTKVKINNEELKIRIINLENDLAKKKKELESLKAKRKTCFCCFF